MKEPNKPAAWLRPDGGVSGEDYNWWRRRSLRPSALTVISRLQFTVRRRSVATVLSAVWQNKLEESLLFWTICISQHSATGRRLEASLHDVAALLHANTHRRQSRSLVFPVLRVCDESGGFRSRHEASHKPSPSSSYRAAILFWDHVQRTDPPSPIKAEQTILQSHSELLQGETSTHFSPAGRVVSLVIWASGRRFEITQILMHINENTLSLWLWD